MAAFETRFAPILSTRAFARRLVGRVAVSATLLAVSLAVGMVGYHLVADLPWVDALYNASMILTGMGPVDRLTTTSSKLFASAYALFSGVVFLTSIGVVVAPVVHRFLHRFHLGDEDTPSKHRGHRPTGS